MKKSFTLIEILIVSSVILIMILLVYLALTFKIKTPQLTKKNNEGANNGIINTSITTNSKTQPQAILYLEKNTAVMTMQAKTTKTTITDNTATFLNVQPFTDAVYKKITNGIKEEIILHQKPNNPPSYYFIIETDSMTIEKINNQYYFFDKKTGQSKLTIPKPFMVDKKGARSEQITISLTKSGNYFKSVVKPDFDWITSSEREYPISIDPSLVLPDQQIRELIDQRTASAKTYQLAENKFMTISSPGILHYRDELNTWQEKNPSISTSNDPEYQYMNITNSFKTYFSTDGFGQKKAVKFQVKDAWMKFKLVNAGGSGSLTNNEYNKFQYQGVYQNNGKTIDADYTLSNSQLLEEIVLYEPQPYPEISQEIELNNAYFQFTGKKIYTYHQTSNELLWIIPEPVMYEKNNKSIRSYGLHYEAKCLEKSLPLEQCRRVLLTKILDNEGRKWLADTSRQYPLIIDLTAGPNDPTSVSDDSSVGTEAWATSDGTIFESDDKFWYATAGSAPTYDGDIITSDGSIIDSDGSFVPWFMDKIPWEFGNYDFIKEFGASGVFMNLYFNYLDINHSRFGLALSVKGSGFSTANYTTHYIIAQGFNFDLPSNAVLSSFAFGVEAGAGADPINEDDWGLYVDHISASVIYSLLPPKPVLFQGVKLEGIRID